MLLRPPSLEQAMLDELSGSDRLSIRRVLRQLARDADALLAVLALGQTIVDFGGDNAVMPRPFPKLERTVPCFVRCRCRDGEEHDVDFVAVRTVVWRPSYGLFVVEATPADSPRLIGLLEAAMEKLEEIIVLSPGESGEAG